MSPRVKKLLWVSGCCLGAGAIVLLAAWAYFSRPAVQREYVLAALAENGVQAELARVEIGLGGAIRLENLDLPLAQGRVRIERGAAEISWSGLWSRRIELEHLEVDGLRVDLTERAKETAPATGAEEETLAEEKSPWRIVARNVTVHGEVRWAEETAAELLVRARRLDSAAGGEGFFQLKEKSGAGRSVEGELSLGWRAKEKQRWPETWRDWLTADAVLALDGQVLGREGKTARVRAESFPGANGQQWKFSAGEKNRTLWVDGSGTVAPDGAVDGRVRLALASAELAEFWDTGKWPEVTAGGEMAVRGGGGKPYAVEGELTGTVAEVARLGGKWPQLPAQEFQLSGAGEWEARRVRVADLTARLAEENGPALELRLTQPLTVEKSLLGWLPVWRTGEWLTLRAKEFPLPLANALLPEATWTVAAGRADADLSLAAPTAGELRLQAREPLRVEGLTVTRAGNVQVENLSGELPVSFVWTEAGLELAATDFAWRSGAEEMLRGTVRVWEEDGALLRWNGVVTARMAGLARQPAWREILAKWRGTDWWVDFSGAGEWSADAGLAVRRAEVRGAEGAAAPVLTAELLQPWKEKGARPEGEWARVRAEGFPLALATPFLGGAQLAGEAAGEVVLSRKENRWNVATEGEGKIVLRDVSYAAADGRSRLEHLFLESRARVAWGDTVAAGWAVDFAEGKIDAGEGHPLEGALALEWRDRLRTARGNLRGDPALLLRQPLLGGFQRLQSAELSLDGEYRDGELAAGKVSLENVCGWDSEPPVGAVRVAVNGLCEDGSGTLRAELTTEDTVGGSGLRLQAELVDNTVRLAAVSGEKVYLATLERLAYLFAPQTAAEEISGPPGAEENPFWAAWPRELTLAVDRVVAEEISVEQLRGRLTADGEKLELKELAARIADGRVSGGGRIDFAKEKTDQRYVLTGETTAEKLPFASAVSLVSPVSSGVIAGVFDTRATLASDGATRDALWERLRVLLDFSSRGGKVRIFEMDNELVRTAGDLTDLAGGVADIVGGLTSNRRAEKISAPVQAFSRLQKYLTDFPYEEMRLRMERQADGSLRIERAEIKNDQLLICGEGMVSAAPGLALADSPLEVTARLDARGDLAVLLGELQLLQGDPDAEGYQPGPTFVLRGSANALQNNLLATLLDAARGIAAQSGLKVRLPGGKAGGVAAPVNEAVQAGEEVLRGLGF